MLRKLVRTLLSVPLVTAPMAAWGLGLGEIQLNSALNQPLNAQIELLSVDPGSADTINVSLAPYETFAKFGLDRPSNLMFLRFAVEQGADGGYRVKVSTDRPVREPFLDFLIELNWRQGRLLREYTLLLDPPDMMAEAPPRLAAPKAAAATTYAPPQSTSPAVRTSRIDSPSGGQGASYGPIRPDDTLWSIAKRMRPEGYTIKQTMIALFQANPDAFLDDNINQLRKGAVLRLDDPSVIAAIGAAEAEREVARQSRRWEELKREMGQQGAARPARDAVAPSQSAAASASGPKLTLVPAEAEPGSSAAGAQGGGSGATNADAIQVELIRALEEAEASAQENQHLRQRVAELEEQIASMQRLLSLKNDDLTQLQAQLGKTDAVQTPAEPQAPKPQPAIPPAPAAQPEPAAQPAQASTPPKPAPAKPAPVKPAPQPPAPEPSLVDVLLDNITTLGLGAVGLMVAGLGLFWARRRKSGGFQESILSGGTSSMLSPKDEESSSSMETSFLSDLASDGIGAPVHDAEVDPMTEADVYLAYGRHQQAEELLRDAINENPERHELLGKLMEVYYKTKNKAAFMAQVEAAHGTLEGTGPIWDKIAAMGHEIAPDHPLFADAPAAPVDEVEDAGAVSIDDVLDIGLDLDALAAEMEPGDDIDLDLGMDLSDLDEPQSTVSVKAAPEPADEAVDEGAVAETPVIEADQEDPLADLNFGTAEAEEPAAESDMLEFDLDGFDLPEPEEKPAAAASVDFGNTIDFEVDSVEPATEASAVAAETGAEPAIDDGLDLDFGAEPAGTEMVSEATGDMPAFDLSDELPDLGASAEDAEAFGLAALEPAAEGVDTDASFATLDEPARDAAPEFGDLSDLGSDDMLKDLDLGGLDDSEFGSLDEVGTKLDLATAYVEMGDADGARDMLEEILQEGDEEQKGKARELLDQIAAQA